MNEKMKMSSTSSTHRLDVLISYLNGIRVEDRALSPQSLSTAWPLTINLKKKTKKNF